MESSSRGSGPAGATSEVGQVRGELGSLRKHLEILAGNIQVLRNKLAPVLAQTPRDPERPGGGKNQDIRKMLVPVAETIRENRDLIEDAINEIASINEAVQL